MGRASIINPGDSHLCENWKGPESEFDSRLERRLKRRALSNNRLKHNGSGKATRSTVKRHGNMVTGKNGHISENEIDEDYRIFLDRYVSHIDVVSDCTVHGSDIDNTTRYNDDNNDNSDPHYREFLLEEKRDLYLNSRSAQNNHVHKRYRGEEERFLNDLQLDTKMSKDSRQRDDTGKLGNKGSHPMKKQTGGLMESQQNLETQRGQKRPRQDVSNVPKSNWLSNVEFEDVDEDYLVFLNSLRIEDDGSVHMGSELLGKSSTVRKNSQVSNHAFNTPEVMDEIDEDYQLYLNSVEIVDGDLVYMPERNTSKTDHMDGGSNSSDSDLILLEPNQIYENTPFVSSKAYDQSWFENKMNPRNNWQFPAPDNSQFRRRLMQDLQRPYDPKEYERLLYEVHQKRQKERHRESRLGVVKSIPCKGVNKSYLELYPDLAKAIAKFKEQERVLGLLRGFIFWLQNITHEKIFKPWQDKSCLEFIQKL